MRFRLSSAPRPMPRHVATAYERRDYVLRRLLALADCTAILAALILAAIPAGGHFTLGSYLLGVLTLPVWLVIFSAYGLYRRDAKRVSHTTIDDVPWLFHGLLIGTLLLWAYYRVLPVHQMTLAQVLVFATSALVLAVALRSVVRRAELRVVGPERVLLIGDHQAANLLSKIKAHPEYGLEPVGVLFHEGIHAHPLSLPLVELGEELDFEHVVRAYQVGRVIVSRTELEEDVLLELMRECRRLCLKVNVLPELFDVMGPSVEVDDVEGVTILGINPPVLLRSERLFKRALDVGVSSVLLLLAAPAMLLLAVAIRLGSRGPVFFRQARVGHQGRPFSVVKFRTMVQDAEARREALLGGSADPNWLKLDHDPRITRVGALLRRTSLDELPQLFNVLKGEMSLVGPRPLPLCEDELVTGWGRGRLDLTPGVTGPWQVLGRTDIPFAEMVKLDYLYVTNWSLWRDLCLIFRTLPAVVARRGAN
jgi:exopolysaccharide biosynthesis polyprenyl glycosylphosphotransferase